LFNPYFGVGDEEEEEEEDEDSDDDIKITIDKDKIEAAKTSYQGRSEKKKTNIKPKMGILLFNSIKKIC
jgi:hypothetical protein